MFKIELRELIESIDADLSLCPEPQQTTLCTGITYDSRAVEAGELFVAVSGTSADGHQYIEQAIAAGAIAVVAECNRVPQHLIASSTVPIFQVQDSRLALSHLADCFYDRPSRKIKCIGVTGTNGKTSTTWITTSLLTRLGSPSAIVGTFGVAVLRSLTTSPEFMDLVTATPDPVATNRFLIEAMEMGAHAAVFEATSQGIAHHRTASIDWDCAVFTNLTRDHLDAHGTMEAYAEAKFRLFGEELAKSSSEQPTAVIWLDDATGVQFYERLKSIPRITLLGVAEKAANAEYRIENSLCTLNGTEFDFSHAGETVHISSQLLGRFNVANISQALTVLHSQGYPLADLAQIISEVPPVPGRLEPVAAPDFNIFVDYCHTSDSLINAQHAIRELGARRLITVFGCGGDRDQGKRPMMGQAVAQFADIGILTSDNPRTEDPDRILKDVIPGLSQTGTNKSFEWHAEVDRRKAIELAIQMAEPGDVVLVAGKGHESYQEINGVRHRFQDTEVCAQAVANLRDSRSNVGNA